MIRLKLISAILLLTTVYSFACDNGEDDDCDCHNHGNIGLLFAGGPGLETNIGDGYSQSIHTYLLSGYIRTFNKNKHFADYYFTELRFDSIHFTNYNYYMDNGVLQNYNADANLHRFAYRLGYEKQLLMGRRPWKRNLGIGAGFFYEGTLAMSRNGSDNSYNLDEEIRRHNLGFIFNTELKLGWLVVGYKYENLFFDMLKHNYINDLETGSDNASELRGLKLSPKTYMFYMGINFTF